jgi:hypothetical protein
MGCWSRRTRTRGKVSNGGADIPAHGTYRGVLRQRVLRADVPLPPREWKLETWKFPGMFTPRRKF